jgi:hypothetical protein
MPHHRARTACSVLLPVLAALAIAAAGCSIIDGDRIAGWDVAKELRTVGLPAEAEILEVADTNESLNDQPIIRLDLLVRPPDRPPFRATVPRFMITYLQVPQFQPGKVIPVRYDPRDPSRVAPDLDRPPVSALSVP